MELAAIKCSTSQEWLLAVMVIILLTTSLWWCCNKRNSKLTDPVEETGREKGKLAVGKTNYEEEENSEK